VAAEPACPAVAVAVAAVLAAAQAFRAAAAVSVAAVGVQEFRAAAEEALAVVARRFEDQVLELEVVTAGAGAEYGRADGGFAIQRDCKCR